MKNAVWIYPVAGVLVCVAIAVFPFVRYLSGLKSRGVLEDNIPGETAGLIAVASILIFGIAAAVGALLGYLLGLSRR